MESLFGIIMVGIGATAATDLWAFARRRLLGLPMPDYGLVGRWLAHMPQGCFRHAAIAAAPRMPGEAVIGWTSHYLIGIAFAGLLALGWGEAWFRSPTVAPALIVGIATVAAPFLLMQPGMGAGIAASRTPRPGLARLHSILMHVVFGFGLYVSGWIVSRFHTGV